MDPILVGVLLSVAFGLFAGSVAWLRSYIRRVETRLDRLEGKVDGLILALARAGFLVDPQSPQAPAPTDPPG